MSSKPASIERPEKPKKSLESCKELFTLIGGIPPQLLVPASKPVTKNPSDGAKLVTKWINKSFESEARPEHLALPRWQKEGDNVPPNPFCKLGKKIDVIKYSDKEYEDLLNELNPSWTKEETDLLWQLCEEYELRFVVIADRFSAHTEYKRSTEELKDRYFSIVKCLLEAKGDTSNQFVRRPYSFDYEVKRKANLEKIYLRTAEHQAIEKQLLDDVKRIEQKIKKEEKEQKNLSKLMNKEEFAEGEPESFSNYRRSTFSAKPMQPIKQPPFAVVSAGGELSPCLSPSGRGGRRDRGSGVYLRSQLVNAPLPIPDKAQKKLSQALKEMGVPEKLLPTAAVVKVYDQLRKEVLTLLSLEKHIQKKEREKKILETRWEDLQKRLKAGQSITAPGVMPNQAMGPMVMPPVVSPGMNNAQMQPPGHPMIANTEPFPQNMGGHMQQMLPPRHSHGYSNAAMSMPMQMAMNSHMQPNGQPQHMVHGHPHHGPIYEGDKTSEGSTIIAATHQRQPPPSLPPQPVPEPPQVKPERVEDAVKAEEKPEEGQEKKKAKRKPRSEKKSKRAATEGSAPDGSSSDKKKKKY